MPSKPAMGASLPKIPSQASGSPKLGLAVAASLAIGLVAGYGVGRATLGTLPGNPMSGNKGSYQDGYEAAHQKLLASGLVAQALSEAHSLSGTVKSVGADRLTIVVPLRSSDPLSETKYPEERTVTVTKDTKIIEQTPKSSEDFQKEFLEFQKANQKGPGDTPPPQPFNDKSIDLTDLKEGNSVVVTSDADILSAETFTATAVTKSAQPGAPSSPAPTQTPPPPPPSGRP